MPDRVFLTETRRDVLNGEFDGPDTTRYSHLSRIRSRARLALKELIEVAESDEIDNADVFETTDLVALLDLLVYPDDPTPFSEFDGDRSDFRERHSYQMDLTSSLFYLSNNYRAFYTPHTPNFRGNLTEQQAELYDHLWDPDE